METVTHSLILSRDGPGQGWQCSLPSEASFLWHWELEPLEFLLSKSNQIPEGSLYVCDLSGGN